MEPIRQVEINSKHLHDVAKALLSFCTTCSGLVQGALHSILLDDLNFSSQECRTCEFLLELVQRCTRPEERGMRGTLKFADRDSSRSIKEGQLPIRLTCMFPNIYLNVLVPIKLDITRKGDLTSQPSFVGATDTSFETVKSWIKDCTIFSSSHSHCRPYMPTYYPTRLLQLDGQADQLSVQLQDREEYFLSQTSDHFRYVALSHCWGPPGSPQLTTTRETLEDRRSGIIWSEIPRTFQHAMVFTFQLGVRYIWIDSLCIVQEDQIDWRREAARMADIYSGSYFTIAAANAPHSGSGLFHEVSDSMSARPFMPLASADGKNEELLVYAKRLTNYEIEDVDEYRLMSRAWTYQERYISPRVIYFLKDELAWTCNSLVDDESRWGSSFVFADARARHASVFGSLSHPPPLYRTAQEYMDVICHWQRVVGEYSKLSLSYEKDKLPAIAGMAKIMKPFRRGRYLAGLWEDSLLVDLTWRSLQRSGARPKEKRAPTWSWASINGEVDFWVWLKTYTVQEIAQVVDVLCDSDDEAYTISSETSCSLMLRGPLLHAIATGGEVFWDVYNTNNGCVSDTNICFLHLCHAGDGGQEGENVYLALRLPRWDEAVFERVGLARARGTPDFDVRTVRRVTII